MSRAEPLAISGDANAARDEDEEEDRLADGDIDPEDRAVMHASGRASAAKDVHGESWISLVGLGRQLSSGRNDLGAMVIVGLALDRLAGGAVHRTTDPPATELRARPLSALSRGDFPPALARDCVAAAFRTSGLDADDARIDAIASRARSSAILPETRLRAMRLWDDASRTTTLSTTDATKYYDAVGANLVLEVRLTWRFDRLVYAGDEPTLERLRLERQEARSRLATRTLEALFAWQRARVGPREADLDSREAMDAELRLSQSRATLDVLTGGWFSDWLHTQTSPETPPEASEADGRAEPKAAASRSP